MNKKQKAARKLEKMLSTKYGIVRKAAALKWLQGKQPTARQAEISEKDATEIQRLIDILKE